MFRVKMFFILFCLLSLTQACFAAVSISVNPVDGSNSLRFDRITTSALDNKQEIRIRINSTNGDRYQVFQRILEPITNEKGDALNLQAIETLSLSNSNSYGTLYLQNAGQLSLGDQLLYSSAQSGQGDSFVVAYSLNQSLINASGRFRGRLIFTVRGISDGSTDQVTIDVFLENITSSLKVSVKGSRESNRINVRSSDVSDQTADFVNVSFTGNSGQEIRIYQDTETFPENEEEQELGTNLLQLDAHGDTDGLHVQGLSPLGSSRTLIYASNKEEDSFNIYFLVNPDQVQQQDAGTYRGMIRYVVESDQAKQEFPIRIHCHIPPVFIMNVTTPPGGVSFSNVLSTNPPQDKQVVVTVLSNLHKPYQVLQDLQTGMTNQQGKEFDSKYFNIQVQIPEGQKGQTDFREFSPVQTGEYPVFSSDASGSGATFTVDYRLQGYSQMSAGNFIAPVRLSLNQK